MSGRLNRGRPDGCCGGVRPGAPGSAGRQARRRPRCAAVVVVVVALMGCGTARARDVRWGCRARRAGHAAAARAGRSRAEPHRRRGAGGVARSRRTAPGGPTTPRPPSGACRRRPGRASCRCTGRPSGPSACPGAWSPRSTARRPRSRPRRRHHGLNAFGCCAGPMQFNVTNGPPSTWRSTSSPSATATARAAIPTRRATTRRSTTTSTRSWRRARCCAIRAPRRSRRRGVVGRVRVLRARPVRGRVRQRGRGARPGLGVYGFCLNCPVDGALVAALDDAYGADARKTLLTAEEREKLEARRSARSASGAGRPGAAAGRREGAAEDARRLEALRRGPPAASARTRRRRRPRHPRRRPRRRAQPPPATEAPPPRHPRRRHLHGAQEAARLRLSVT